ncbi:glycosyltransferase family 4 protein [Dongia rigui]|uniref:Glycosyltransferase family 4 protein n=1 Tax=Dongia rigui TaxID=940149 RepID=A0ABU5DXX3_9PROT|nr:glycosyltransferase family 4 protein [Dongia rigui]MDY0871760.1 glycosyltransferase family 4 protein [Dongia rigui]
MKIAFYAPLKAPDHPDPSGDRTVGRLLLAALRRGGFTPVIASRLRSRLSGDSLAEQKKFAAKGKATAARLIAKYRKLPKAARPRAWLTYHLYYKAVDWIGPEVASALDIPYLVAEASHAPKRAKGPFLFSHDAAEAAMKQAAAIFCLNPVDKECLHGIVAAKKLIDLPPFLDIDAFLAGNPRGPDRGLGRLKLSQQYRLDPDMPWLLAVGMMRKGDKLASYHALAEALRHVTRAYQVLVVGDGPARAEVEAAFTPIAKRVVWLRQKPAEHLPEIYASADLFVWPAINEAFGMALLEAQACGTPVIAGASGGVPGIVADGETGWLSAPGDTTAFAADVDFALEREMAPIRLVTAAHARKFHDIAAAAATLKKTLEKVTGEKVTT